MKRKRQIWFNLFFFSTSGGGQRRHDRFHPSESVSDEEIGVELCRHRLGRLGDLSERIRDQLLCRPLFAAAGQRVQTD